MNRWYSLLALSMIIGQFQPCSAGVMRASSSFRADGEAKGANARRSAHSYYIGIDCALIPFAEYATLESETKPASSREMLRVPNVFDFTSYHSVEMVIAPASVLENCGIFQPHDFCLTED